jgi:predicted amidophosphoribosyltransferase
VAIDVLSLVFPRRCAGCDTRGMLWCMTCASALEPLPAVRCGLCGAPTRWPVTRCRECRQMRFHFTRSWSAVAHRGPAAALLRRWKDGGLELSAVAAETILRQLPEPPRTGAAVVPVPADPARVRWRGVDGPAALAARLADAWGLELRRDLLVRERSVPPQRRLDAVARRRNLALAFAAREDHDGAVILVDDVYTTGATADACSAVLRRVGADPIHVVTFARALRR